MTLRRHRVKESFLSLLLNDRKEKTLNPRRSLPATTVLAAHTLFSLPRRLTGQLTDLSDQSHLSSSATTFVILPETGHDHPDLAPSVSSTVRKEPIIVTTSA